MSKTNRKRSFFTIKKLVSSKASIILICASFLLFSFALGIDFADNLEAPLIDAASYRDGEIAWKNSARKVVFHGGTIFPGEAKFPYFNRTLTAGLIKTQEESNFSQKQIDFIFECPNAIPAVETNSIFENVLIPPKANFFSSYGTWNSVIDSRIQTHELCPLEKGKLPSSNSEIAISDMTAALLVGQGYLDENGLFTKPSSWDDLLGASIASYQVTGIIKTNFATCPQYSKSISLEKTEEELSAFRSFFLKNKRAASSVMFQDEIEASCLFYKTSGNLIADSFFFRRLGCDAPYSDLNHYSSAYVFASSSFLLVIYLFSLVMFLIGFFCERRSFKKKILKEPMSYEQTKRSQLFLVSFVKLLPMNLIVGAAGMVLSEIVFLIINACAGGFFFSHFLLSSLFAFVAVLASNALFALSKAKALKRNAQKVL